MIKIKYVREKSGLLEVVRDGQHVFVQAVCDELLTSEEMTDDLVIHEKLDFVELKDDGKKVKRKQYYTANDLEDLTVKQLTKLAKKQEILLASKMLKDDIVDFLVSSKIEK